MSWRRPSPFYPSQILAFHPANKLLRKKTFSNRLQRTYFFLIFNILMSHPRFPLLITQAAIGVPFLFPRRPVMFLPPPHPCCNEHYSMLLFFSPVNSARNSDRRHSVCRARPTDRVCDSKFYQLEEGRGTSAALYRCTEVGGRAIRRRED